MMPGQISSDVRKVALLWINFWDYIKVRSSTQALHMFFYSAIFV